jgi:hypothetical protein
MTHPMTSNIPNYMPARILLTTAGSTLLGRTSLATLTLTPTIALTLTLTTTGTLMGRMSGWCFGSRHARSIPLLVMQGPIARTLTFPIPRLFRGTMELTGRQWVTRSVLYTTALPDVETCTETQPMDAMPPSLSSSQHACNPIA